MKHCLALVVSNLNVAAGHHRLRLTCPEIAISAKAGHFVHVLPRGTDVFDPLLRRAFSILSVQDTTFDLLFRVQGRGTQRLSAYRSGDALDVLGPLGMPFTLPEAHATSRVILVGGGVGVPPLAMLAEQMKKDHESVLTRAPINKSEAEQANQVVAFIGARSRDDVLCLDDFAQHNTPVEVATDDGSMGRRGLVTKLLKAHLEERDDVRAESNQKTPEVTLPEASRTNTSLVYTCVYACGPLPMLRAVAAICEQHDVPCQVSLEENMPCGVGVCNGCVVRVKQADDEYGYYRRVCVEGPVMWSHEVAWDAF